MAPFLQQLIDRSQLLLPEMEIINLRYLSFFLFLRYSAGTSPWGHPTSEVSLFFCLEETCFVYFAIDNDHELVHPFTIDYHDNAMMQ